jgi:hypothetical protein
MLCALFEQFAGMLRDKEGRSEEQARRRLQEWTDQSKASGIAELKAFAVKLLQDMEAVEVDKEGERTELRSQTRKIVPRLRRRGN